MKKTNNKQDFYNIFSKVNKVKINESILSEIENNIITVSDPLLKKLINNITQAQSVEFDTEFADCAVSFKGFNIIDLSGYNNSENIQDVYFTFDTVEIFDFTNEQEYHLDDNAITLLTKFIWNHQLWSNRVYEFVGEEMDKYNDPSNYIDEEEDLGVDSEIEVGENPEVDTENNDENSKEDFLTNMLLGFKPNNVGDYVNNK